MNEECNRFRPILKGHNAQLTAYTMSCTIACVCGQPYMDFLFGSKVEMDGKK